MTRTWHDSGVSQYLRSSVYDIDVEELRDAQTRPYLEHRLRQVDGWLDYLRQRYHGRARRDAAVWRDDRAAVDMASDVLDVAYLQAVRRAIAEALETL